MFPMGTPPGPSFNWPGPNITTIHLIFWLYRRPLVALFLTSFVLVHNLANKARILRRLMSSPTNQC